MQETLVQPLISQAMEQLGPHTPVLWSLGAATAEALAP